MGAINIFSPSWDGADSYGIIARELAHALRRQGFTVNPFGEKAPRRLIQTVIGGLILGYPTNARQFGGLAAVGPRVFVTMFESTDLPPGWVGALNTGDAVVVPSAFCADVFRRAGVTPPIHVVPLGIGRSFRYIERPARTPYTFLAFADRGRRKGFHLATAAFYGAFANSPHYRLILKCRKDALPFRINNPNIEVLDQDLSEKQLAALYGTADCLLFPSAGEGWGLPPREFAATGGLSIVTNWSGLADDLPAWGLPIRYDLEPAWAGEDGLEGVGQWAKPDLDDLVSTLHHTQAHRAYYRARSRAAADFVRKHYRWSTFARQVAGIWKGVLRGDRVAAHAIPA